MVTVTTSRRGRRGRASSTSRAGDVVLAQHLDHALRPGRGPGGRTTTRRPVAPPAADVGDRLLDVAAVGVDRPASAVPATHGPSSPILVGLVVEAERADRPPGLALARARAARTSPSARYDAAPRSIGALPPAGGRGPAGAEELLAGGDQVVGAGAGPLGVEHQHVGVRRAAGRRAAPSRRPAPAPATPCPRRRCPRRSCR